MKCFYLNMSLLMIFLLCVFTSADDSTDDSYRLPMKVKPHHYYLNLFPNIYTNNASTFQVVGKVRILVECKVATDEIVLHYGHDNTTISRLILTPKADNEDFISSDGTIQHDAAKGFLTLKFQRNMMVNRNYTLLLKFNYTMKRIPEGIYYSSYQDGGQTKYVVNSQFQAISARKAFPCFDEPGLKATFSVKIDRHANFTSLSTMPLEGTNRDEDDPTRLGVQVVTDTFLTTPPMSTYYLAIAVSQFPKRSVVTSKGTKIGVHARPSLHNSTVFALDCAEKGMTFFEEYFGSNYPLAKLDHFASPYLYSGAMENWGLAIYREDHLTYTPGVSNYQYEDIVADIIYHEIAHMWFGDLVTPEWWDDLWINEGFAPFLAILASDHLNPSWKVMDYFLSRHTATAFKLDAALSAKPVYAPVHNAALIYPTDLMLSKSACIVRMMRHFLGSETFKKGMVKILQENEYKTINHDILYAALTQQATDDGKPTPVSVKDIMDNWLKQKNFPLVTVERDNQNSSQIVVKQQRFTEVQPEAGNDYVTKWTIPVTLTSSKSPNFDEEGTQIYWIYKNENRKAFHLGQANLPSLTDQNGWILANTNWNGYYRVQYTKENWNNLTKQLDTNHTVFPIANRAQLISDSFALLKRGFLEVSIFMNALKYLNEETSYLVWKIADPGFSNIYRLIVLKNNTLRNDAPRMKNFLQERIRPAFNRHRFNATGKTRIEMLEADTFSKIACKYDLNECETQALSLFRQWMRSPSNNPINTAFKRVVYCSAVKSGGMAEWNFALETYRTIQTNDKVYLFEALACSTNSTNIKEYLDVIGSSDRFGAIANVAKRDADTAWQSFEQNFETAIIGLYPTQIESLADGFHSTSHKNRVQNLKDRYTTLYPEDSNPFEKVLENIKLNFNWISHYSGKLNTYLNSLDTTQ